MVCVYMPTWAGLPEGAGTVISKVKGIRPVLRWMKNWNRSLVKKGQNPVKYLTSA